jgi:hypothetical protein
MPGSMWMSGTIPEKRRTGDSNWEVRIFSSEQVGSGCDSSMECSLLGAFIPPMLTGTFNTCLDSSKYAAVIRSEILEGAKVGVNGTPSMFIKGRFLSGDQPYDDLAKMIDDELNRAAKK